LETAIKRQWIIPDEHRSISLSGVALAIDGPLARDARMGSALDAWCLP